MEELKGEMLNDEKAPAALKRLQERQAALVIKADQLAARAAHLQRVMDAEYRRSRRRRDAHDKIVLGALVVMVGLHRFQVLASGASIVVDTTLKQPIVSDETLSFDKDLLIGALLKLSRQLNGNETTTIAQHTAMRMEGAAFRKLSKLARRRRILMSGDAVDCIVHTK